MAKTAQKNHSAIAEAGPAGNSPEELARLAEIEVRLADLAADPAIEQERAQRQALVDEDEALRQLARERYDAPDFSYNLYLATMTPAQAKRFCDQVDVIGVLTDEENQRLEQIRVELDAFPLQSEMDRNAEIRDLQSEKSRLLAAPQKRVKTRQAEAALESARELYSQAGEAMRSLEEDMAAMIPRLLEVKRLSQVATQAELRAKSLASGIGSPLTQLWGDGPRGLNDVELLYLFQRVAKSVTDRVARTTGAKEDPKSQLLADRASRCTLNWVNNSENQEFEGEYEDV